jgi:hypothetical protein
MPPNRNGMMSGGMVAGDEGAAWRAPTADLARSYREAVRTSLQEQLGDSEQNLIAGREELQRLSRRFVTLERQLVAQARRTDELQELSEAAASAEAELARLLAVPGVQHIEVHGQVLHILTAPIQIAWEGERYDLGRYRIGLDLGGDLRVESIDGLGPKPGWDHPHVQDGRPCLGNAREGVLKLIARYELALAAQVLVGFLETFQPEGSYSAIEGWPRAHVDG